MGPGAYLLRESPFTLSPSLMLFFWCVVGLNVFQLGWKVAALLIGTWQKPSRVQHMAFSLVGLIPLGVLLSLPNHMFVLLKHPELDLAKYGSAVDTINASIYKSMLLVAAIVVLKLVWELGQMSIEGYRRRVAAR
jgi:hypothetical protein